MRAPRDEASQLPGVVAGVSRRGPDGRSAFGGADLPALHYAPAVAGSRRSHGPPVVLGLPQSALDLLFRVPRPSHVDTIQQERTDVERDCQAMWRCRRKHRLSRWRHAGPLLFPGAAGHGGQTADRPDRMQTARVPGLPGKPPDPPGTARHEPVGLPPARDEGAAAMDRVADSCNGRAAAGKHGSRSNPGTGTASRRQDAVPSTRQQCALPPDSAHGFATAASDGKTGAQPTKTRYVSRDEK